MDSNYFSNLRVKSINRLLIVNLSINSISNTLGQLKSFVPGKIDILVIAETRFDSTFPTSQFLIEGYRFDRNRNGVGGLIYVWEHIPSQPLMDLKLPHDTKWSFVDLSLRKVVAL